MADKVRAYKIGFINGFIAGAKVASNECEEQNRKIAILSLCLAEACEECQPYTWTKAISDANNGKSWRDILKEAKK